MAKRKHDDDAGPSSKRMKPSHSATSEGKSSESSQHDGESGESGQHADSDSVTTHLKEEQAHADSDSATVTAYPTKDLQIHLTIRDAETLKCNVKGNNLMHGITHEINIDVGKTGPGSFRWVIDGLDGYLEEDVAFVLSRVGGQLRITRE